MAAVQKVGDALARSLQSRTRALARWSDGPSGQRFVLVMGNEAGDVDSLVSSVALSLCWNVVREHCGVAASELEVAVPVAHFPRQEFRLRGDARLVFKSAGFSFDEHGAPTDLLFLDEVAGLIGQPGRGRFSLALTDHNEPSSKVGSMFGGFDVTCIVDHHQDAGRFEEAAPRLVDPSCGSASSLVAELALDAGAGLSLELVRFLMGAVLIDTRGFNPNGKRYSERDVKVRDRLFATYPESRLSEDEQTAWFKELIEARFDTSGLSASDLLRLDLKVATVEGDGPFGGSGIGFASVMASQREFLDRAGSVDLLAGEMQQLCDSLGLEALVSLTKSEDPPENSSRAARGKRCKGACVFAVPGKPGLRDAICEAFKGVPGNLPDELAANPLFVTQGVSTNGFAPEPWDEFSGAQLDTFHIRKLPTRKSIMPAILGVLGALG